MMNTLKKSQLTEYTHNQQNHRKLKLCFSSMSKAMTSMYIGLITSTITVYRLTPTQYIMHRTHLYLMENSTQRVSMHGFWFDNES